MSLWDTMELIHVVHPVNNVEHHKGKREEEPGALVDLRDVVRVKELGREPFTEGAPRAWGGTVIRLRVSVLVWIKAHNITIKAPGTVNIILELLLKVKVATLNSDVIRQATNVMKGAMDLIKVVVCFLHTPLAVDKQMLPTGAMVLALIGVGALFRVFWVTGLSTAMGLCTVADFSRNNTVININIINANAIAGHGLL